MLAGIESSGIQTQSSKELIKHNLIASSEANAENIVKLGGYFKQEAQNASLQHDLVSISEEARALQTSTVEENKESNTKGKKDSDDMSRVSEADGDSTLNAVQKKLKEAQERLKEAQEDLMRAMAELGSAKSEEEKVAAQAQVDLASAMVSGIQKEIQVLLGELKK